MSWTISGGRFSSICRSFVFFVLKSFYFIKIIHFNLQGSYSHSIPATGYSVDCWKLRTIKRKPTSFLKIMTISKFSTVIIFVMVTAGCRWGLHRGCYQHKSIIVGYGMNSYNSFYNGRCISIIQRAKQCCTP